MSQCPKTANRRHWSFVIDLTFEILILVFLVPPAGIEPATYGLGVRRSIL